MAIVKTFFPMSLEVLDDVVEDEALAHASRARQEHAAELQEEVRDALAVFDVGDVLFGYDLPFVYVEGQLLGSRHVRLFPTRHLLDLFIFDLEDPRTVWVSVVPLEIGQRFEAVPDEEDPVDECAHDGHALRYVALQQPGRLTDAELLGVQCDSSPWRHGVQVDDLPTREEEPSSHMCRCFKPLLASIW